MSEDKGKDLIDKSRPLEPEEKGKLAAETAKLQAETAKIFAECDEALAKAEKAQYEASVTKIIHDREQEKREREVHSDHHHHVYPFHGGVDKGSVESCIDQLNFWHRKDPNCEIEIVFNSPGGAVIEGMALFDHIRYMIRNGHDVVTHCTGMAASMGSILLQAGKTRVMDRESYILIHEVSSIAFGSFGDIEDQVEFLNLMQDRILGIYAERSNMSKVQIKKKWSRKDWWIDSAQALKHGFVDEVR